MPRSYRHISDYEREILKLKEQGLTLREIGEKLGFTRKQGVTKQLKAENHSNE